MPHNNSRMQGNPYFPAGWGAGDPFLNRFKSAPGWTNFDNSGPPLPSTLDANGYPVTILNGGVGAWVNIVTEEYLSGDWKVRWTGEGTISTGGTPGGTALTGSKSGVNGSFTFRPTSDAVYLGIVDINPADPITNLELYYEEQEALLDAGEIFTPKFKEICQSLGIIRFLDWTDTNASPLTKWEHRKPVDYVFWNGVELRASMYRGDTGNTGDDFTIDLGDGGSPADKDIHLVRWNASASSSVCTLNGKTLKGPAGDSMFSAHRPSSGVIDVVVFDEELDVWMNMGGFDNKLPFEVMLRLCKEVGAHPWFNVPHLSLDHPEDFAAPMASFVKAYTEAEAPWMKPRYEPSNEIWNFASAFPQTGYARAKALARWGVENQQNDWYGRVCSLMGQAVSAVYSDDRSKYEMICGVQAASTPASSAGRMSGRHVSVDGGSPASLWATVVSPAHYWRVSIAAQTELNLAYEYEAGDDTVKAAKLVEYLDYAYGPAANLNIAQTAGWFQDYVAWAEGFSPAKYVSPYEGGYEYVEESADIASSITAATKATSCVLTLSGRVPAVGKTLAISGVTGMTELNGNTYDVTAVTGQNVTIDVNSTGFTTYSSGGSATLVGSRNLLNGFRRASKFSPAMEEQFRFMYSELLRRRVRYPSVYVLSSGSPWGVWDPNIYRSPEPPQWTAIKDVAYGETPVKYNFIFDD